MAKHVPSFLRPFPTPIFYSPTLSVDASTHQEPQNSSSATQQMSHTSWKQQFHWRVHKRPPTSPVQSHSNSVHAFPFSSFKIHFSFTPPSSPLAVTSSNQSPVCISPLADAWHATCQSRLIILITHGEQYKSRSSSLRCYNALPVISSAPHSQRHRSMSFP